MGDTLMHVGMQLQEIWNLCTLHYKNYSAIWELLQTKEEVYGKCVVTEQR